MREWLGSILLLLAGDIACVAGRQLNLTFRGRQQQGGGKEVLIKKTHSRRNINKASISPEEGNMQLIREGATMEQ